MFKPLLRTLPTLSGNFTLVCKVNDFNQLSSKEYEVYIRDASLVPLQNKLFNKDINVNLAKDQYEYSIKKFYKTYSNIFYKENYPYNKNDFMELDEYEVNYVNDSRNKDYEFGCKRLYYSQNNYQFMFYAPFYIDDVNDLPDYFYIIVKFNNTLEKTIKIMIDKKDSSNYLRLFLRKYVEQLDNNVIYCLPDSKQATYFGIDVNKGGLVKYVDNVFGNLYNNQNTINNFDYTICGGFECHKLIMKQIIPISFAININDFLNYHELDFFNFNTLNIKGFYYKDNVKIDFYDFNIDYTHLYQKYLKYNSSTGKYQMDFGYDGDKKIDIMNVSYPSLNESKYVKYRFTNKITPKYCRFKLQQSEDDNPYIINMSYGFSNLQNPNKRYGEFPTLFKDIFPISIVKNNNMILPINDYKKEYEADEANLNKYIKLMTNFYSAWYTIFDENEDIFSNKKNWSDVDNDYAYYKGILYKLGNDTIGRNDIDKFGVFLNIKMNYISNTSVLNDILVGKYILSNTNLNNSIKIYEIDTNLSDHNTSSFTLSTTFNYNESNPEDSYYSLVFDLDNKPINIFSINRTNKKSNHIQYFNYNIMPYSTEWYSNLYKVGSKNSSYLLYNEKMKKDPYGTFILDKNYYKKNTYYDFDEVKNILKNILGPQIFDHLFEDEFNLMKINGYKLIDIYNPINLYQKYNINGEEHYKVILESNEISNIYDSLMHPWYLTTAFSTEKIKIDELYDNLNDNTQYYSDFRIFEYRNFINQNDLFYFLKNKFIEKAVWPTKLLATSLTDILKEATDLTDSTQVKFLMYTKTLLMQNKNYTYFNNMPMLPLLITNISSLKVYNYNPYSNESVKIVNYFTEDNSVIDNNIYVDTYNLNKYIVLYNSINTDNQIKYIKSNSIETQELNKYIKSLNLNKKYSKINYISNDEEDIYEKKTFYSNIINRDHIEQYIKKLLKNENIFDETLEIKRRRLLDVLYVKERVWYIDTNNKISIKDRYVLLYDYLLNIYNEHIDEINNNSNKYDNLIALLTLYNSSNESNDNTFENEYLIKLISKKRNANDLFIISLSNDVTIEVNLVFLKTFIKLNDDLLKILNNDKCYLYLYSRISNKENNQTWNIHNSNTTYNINYEIKNIDDCLSPLFSNVWMNSTDVDLIRSMIYNNKINNNKINTNNDNFFIDLGSKVDQYVSSKCTVSIINNEFDKFNINRIESNNQIYNAVLTLKDFDKTYYYEKFIPSLGVSLYSIYDINHVNLDSYDQYLNDSINSYEYDSDNNLNIVKTNNHTYAFYMLNVALDNTNNSFNINNSFDISASFSSINGKHIITGNIINEENNIYNEENNINEHKDKYNDLKYLKSVFPIMQPFMKFNIFKDFANKSKNIMLFPLENEININYASSILDKDDEYKYLMLKENEDDIIYGSIIKYSKERRLKLLRYFGYITPIIQKKSILNNIWENKYIRKENNSNIEKYNILYNNTLNIYKYQPIYLCNKYDSVNNVEISHEYINQYEYKHFNDNMLYNLQEEINISLPNIVEYEELINTYETDEYTLKIFTDYLNKVLNSKLNTNIILFLFNKYKVSYTSVPYKLNSSKSKRLYKISYKFNLK